MRKYHFWDERDRDLLSRLYPVIPSRILAHQMGVSEAGIRQVAHRMGLKKGPHVRRVGDPAFEIRPRLETLRGTQIGSPALARLCSMLDLVSSIPEVDTRGLRKAVRTAIELAREAM